MGQLERSHYTLRAGQLRIPWAYTKKLQFENVLFALSVQMELECVCVRVHEIETLRPE